MRIELVECEREERLKRWFDCSAFVPSSSDTVHKNQIPKSRWTAREMVAIPPANVPTSPSGYALSRPQEPPINPESVVQGTTHSGVAKTELQFRKLRVTQFETGNYRDMRLGGIIRSSRSLR